MFLRFVLALALAFGFATVALMAPAPPGASAATCLMERERDPWKRLEGNLEYAQLVVIGTVVAEAQTGWEGYRSTVRIDAVLKGEMPGPEVELPRMGDGWNCVNSPRLHEGSTVLLLLTRSSGPLPMIWMSGPVGGNVVLEAGVAVLDDFHVHRGQRLGRTEDVVRGVGTRLGASDESIDHALAAVARTQPLRPPEEGISILTLLAVGITGLVTLTALALAARRSGLKG